MTVPNEFLPFRPFLVLLSFFYLLFTLRTGPPLIPVLITVMGLSCINMMMMMMIMMIMMMLIMMMMMTMMMMMMVMTIVLLPKHLRFKQFTVINDTTYINISQDIVHKYNNTFHNSIKMTPSETQKKEKVKHCIS